MSKHFKITNKSEQAALVPGPGRIVLGPKESAKFRSSSLFINMAKSNKVFDVEVIDAGNSDDLVVESSKTTGKPRKAKRAGKPTAVPAKRLDDSKKVNEDG